MNPRLPTLPLSDEMLTTAPVPSFSSITGTAARVSACAVDTFHSKARVIALGVVSRNARGMDPPTLLTTMSRRPKASLAAPARPATASRSLKSAVTMWARQPAASIRPATAPS